MHMNQNMGAARVPGRIRAGRPQAREKFWNEELDPGDSDQPGHASYYVKSTDQDRELWKVSFDRSGVEFHERVDADSLGITDEDLSDSVRMTRWPEIRSSFFPVTSHIEKKLMILDIY